MKTKQKMACWKVICAGAMLRATHLTVHLCVILIPGKDFFHFPWAFVFFAYWF